MIKNVVFDLGGVVVGRDFPRLAQVAGEAFSFIAGNDFPEYWAEFDRGIYTREEVTRMLAEDRGCSLEKADRDIQNLLELLQEVPETVELIKELKAAGYKLYVLSNMSVEFFAHLKTFPVFDYFDGCTVSSYEHINKPDEGIYKALLHNHSLKAEECLFLDDKPANTAAAEALGFQTVPFDQNSIPVVRQRLGLE